LQTSKTGWTGAGETHYFGLTIGQEFCVGLNMDKPLAGSTGVYNFYLVNRNSGHTGEIMWRIQYIVGVTYATANPNEAVPSGALSFFGITLPAKKYIHAGSVADDGTLFTGALNGINYTMPGTETIILNYPSIGPVPYSFVLQFVDGNTTYFGGSKRDNHFINYQNDIPDAPAAPSFPADLKPYLIESV
jgi:hypothetical protein